MSTPLTVLVTGFGPFLDITTNPSWEIAHRLPSSLTGLNGETITIIIPPEPTPAAYHKILAQVPKLIEKHSPDMVVHMGLDVDSGPGVFKVERSAPKEGYHEFPDVERRVFTRAENKKTFGKAPATLATTLDLVTAVDAWRDSCSSLSLAKLQASGTILKAKAKGKEKQMVEVQLTDDVGTYVCGFDYYISLLEMQKKTGKREAVFFHVPKLESHDELRVGTRVTEELIKALFGVLK
ncbi:peptidase C15, pyroglutamyl peptidase I-like protein [Cucurbitaria berberidis CBS 394.84]|uniref:Peptidase C15, pyroglutamyl peptidase I-like protein n=1 Tax=Cucurbitaria berberidis CBS 394.84 TaxID=1168544 RepID=A0A9P4GPL3_9PLEO|nr:peptidase C15, pyroglutamyl peptidase I-like protein [Cucurbitaria berberidis CBS 394.84]KAF1848997.1 peptidase C15, pyroglutamyl peptidase I-like protein [Cucurbitaria berberidis CBS 394.84]